jgi:hypothetical protein
MRLISYLISLVITGLIVGALGRLAAVRVSAVRRAASSGW